MKPNSTVLLLVAAMMLSWNGSSPSAFGQEKDRKPQELFKKLDKNKDSKLTVDEIGKERRKFFDRLVRTGDKNKDGQLNREEFLNALKQQDRPAARSADSKDQSRKRPGVIRAFNPKQLFARLDRNKDGKLSLNEIPEPMRPRMKPLFEMLEKKVLTQEEFVKAMASRSVPAGEKGRPATNRKPMQKRERESDRASDRKPSDRDAVRKPGNRASDRRPGDRDTARKPGNRDSDRRFGDRDSARRPSDREGDRRPGKRDGDRRPGEGRRGDRERGERPDDRNRDGNRGRGERGPGGFGGPAFFRLLDENRDGQLSKSELAKASEKLMELDRNKDGSLDPRELFGGGPQGFRGPFGSRSGSRSGFRPGFRPPFERRGDGPRPEFRSPSRRPGDGPPSDTRRPERRPDESSGDRRRPDGSVQRSRGDSNRSRAGDAQRSRSRGRRPEGEAGRGPGSPGFVEGLLKRLDKNSDGKLSKSESSERLLEGFSRLDGNKDGSLDLEELKKAFSRRGGRDAQQ